ncbi:hypothetical protein [Rhodopirellula sp. MGV]|uniref:hypothetical protein n=1 Tax=Rhodopirellula sp. MGV TaxID=2023130 RepID=UPI000B978B49|nr:hypothetical protein [Rhodopirellula sp. MGV]OYP37108.1 hypothetical protein CGZ80_06045 [Rhodopirellula sp. MGV]PNY34397.1 hypothetical protein C2E31_23375 [Rhodopirellula baltica]
MTQTVNPYAAPGAESLDTATPSPSDYVSERLEFSGVLTRRDYQDAIVYSGIRQDTRRFTRLVIGIVGVTSLVTLISFFRANQLLSPQLLQSLLAQIILVAGFTWLWSFNRWQLRHVIAACQSATGPVSGWIDHEAIVIRSERTTESHPLESLIASKANPNRWVFTFTKTYTFFYVLPFDFFDKQSLARHVAQHWGKLRPPQRLSVVDSAQLSPPELGYLREPAQDAILFDGPVYKGDERGTAFHQASRSFLHRSLLSVAFMAISVIGYIVILNNGVSGPLGFGILWLTIAIAFVALRVWLERRRARDKRGEMYWHSKGYFQDSGFELMSQSGQRQGGWDYFCRYETTDRIIVLYPGELDLFAVLVAKNQFASEQAWEDAVGLVKSKLPTTTQYNAAAGQTLPR